MVDLARANAKLREAVIVYALLRHAAYDEQTIERAAREVDRRCRALRLLAEVAES